MLRHLHPSGRFAGCSPRTDTPTPPSPVRNTGTAHSSKTTNHLARENQAVCPAAMSAYISSRPPPTSADNRSPVTSIPDTPPNLTADALARHRPSPPPPLADANSGCTTATYQIEAKFALDKEKYSNGCGGSRSTVLQGMGTPLRGLDSCITVTDRLAKRRPARISALPRRTRRAHTKPTLSQRPSLASRLTLRVQTQISPSLGCSD
jgi:hypothetical protein